MREVMSESDHTTSDEFMYDRKAGGHEANW